MGCCFSTPNTKKYKHDLKNQLTQFRSHAPKPNTTHEVHNKTPPLPPPPLFPQHLEEEAVKEVLSETPISKPHQVPILMARTNTQMPEIEKGEVPIMNKACSMSESFSDEISQISVTCSISESFSSTTTATAVANVTENREDEGTSKRRTPGTQNRKKRSYAIDGNRIRERECREKYPARMPEKRVPMGSPVVCRRQSGQLRHDPGEGSRTRPMSPSSARKVSGGVSQSQLKQQGGAGRRLPPVKCVKKERVRDENDVVRQEESLENPHVSLECFIFL